MRTLPTPQLLAPVNRHGVDPKAAADQSWYKIVNKSNKKSSVTKVYIYDAIGGWFGIYLNDFIKELNDVETDEIHLHINSPGGSVYDGIAIYNALKQHDAKVTTYIDSLAASAASFIALAGEEVIIARNATMMIHDAMGLCMGNQADMLETAELLDAASNNIADIYAFNAGGDKTEWRELMRAETWYSAPEAVEAGLADEMLDADPEEEDEDAETENKWNLADMFNYAGRQAAPSPKFLRNQVRNQLKEASMGNRALKNEDGTQPAESSENGTKEERMDDTEGTPPEQSSTPPANEPAPAPEQDQQNRFSAVINGARTTDIQAVQNHINALETFRNETIEQSRRDFVKGLANRNIIPATQIDKLTNHVLSLTDEQFSDYAEMYSDAQPQSMFEQHGNSQPGNEMAPGVTASVSDEISSLEQIVADHRRTGMSEEVLKTKASYNRLQQLKSQNNNA